MGLRNGMREAWGLEKTQPVWGTESRCEAGVQRKHHCVVSDEPGLRPAVAKSLRMLLVGLNHGKLWLGGQIQLSVFVE